MESTARCSDRRAGTYIVHFLPARQVFHVPLEERRYQFEELSFGGETRQSEIVREIQDKTGCDIEMTQVSKTSLTSFT